MEGQEEYLSQDFKLAISRGWGRKVIDDIKRGLRLAEVYISECCAKLSAQEES